MIIKLFFSVLILISSLALPRAGHSEENLSIQEIKQSYQRHAALTQLHRWYLAYEHPDYDMRHQLDILDPAIHVSSTLGTANGHAEYVARVQQIPSQWQNGHFVDSTTFQIQPDGTLKLHADITYQNRGMLPEGQIRRVALSYAMGLAFGTEALPKFTHIKITPKEAAHNSGASSGSALTQAYGHNRLRSLVHYWLTLIETPERAPEPVREILAKDFNLNFPSGTISTYEAFAAWLAGPASQIAASAHKISDFSYTVSADGIYDMTLILDWTGLLPDMTQMRAKTRHQWLVEDIVTDRYAKIQEINVEILVPFTRIPKK